MTANSTYADFSSTIIRTHQANQYRHERKRLKKIAAMLLHAENGDPVAAEIALDEVIDGLFESGALSMWRYRIVLGEIREGARP
jgi:hypothetical protein